MNKYICNHKTRNTEYRLGDAVTFSIVVLGENRNMENIHGTQGLKP